MHALLKRFIQKFLPFLVESRRKRDREIIASTFPREMRRGGDARARVPSFLKVFRNSDCNPPRARIPRGEATLKAIFLHPPPFYTSTTSQKSLNSPKFREFCYDLPRRSSVGPRSINTR